MSELFAACRRRDEPAVRELLGKGESANALNATGQTVLMAAAQNCMPSIARLLLEHGADPTAVDSRGHTAIAYVHGNLETLRLLIPHVDVNQVDHRGRTPLMMACEYEQSTVRFLLEYGASVDATGPGGCTPIGTAAALGHTAATRALLEFGADPNKANNRGHTAYWFANTNGQFLVMNLLRTRPPLVRDCRRSVESAVGRAGDRDVARLCGDFVSMVDRR